MFRLDLMWAKWRGLRLVWTIHNRVAHESVDPAEELSLLAVLALEVDHCIVHSASAIDDLRRFWGPEVFRGTRCSVIRHGNYAGYYPPAHEAAKDLRMDFRLNPEHLVILFFGMVRPYKGVERLLASLHACGREDIRVLVAGRAKDEKLIGRLRKLAECDSRVLLDLRFIEDHEVAAYFEVADAVAIPFEKTLTSGSAVLAMTMGCALLMPDCARVLDLGEDEGALFYSDHQSDEQSNDDLSGLLAQLEKPRLQAMGNHNRVTAEQFGMGCGWQRDGRSLQASTRRFVAFRLEYP